jgi:hypothetical protein
MPTSEQWQSCLAQMRRLPLSGSAWRVSGRLAPLATAALVDSSGELQQLEGLLRHSDRLRAPPAMRLDPLLALPWQRRPHPGGSRFAHRCAAPILYGSLSPETALAEAAHRRTQFWRGMATPPPSARLLAEQQLFCFAYHCVAGVRLQSRAFQPQRQLLLADRDYGATQQLGQLLRAEGIAGFEDPSVRCPDYGLNLALLSPEQLSAGRPGEVQHWLVETDAGGVSFTQGQQLHHFRHPPAD